ncbi:MAG: hypothetical protein FWC09_09735, partial [Lachnospiraceae bacterium]|nr:hypothetical protein [Lachnospiraceae bacterium]
MMIDSLAQPIAMLVTQSLLLFSTLLLIVRRYDNKKVIRICIISILVICSFSIVVNNWVGFDYYYRVVIFVVTIPYFIVSFFIAKDRNLSLLFTYATISMIGCISVANGYVTTIYFNNPWSNTLMRFLSLSLFSYLCYLIRGPYIRLTHVLKRGWLLLYITPTFICVAFLIWFDGLVPEMPFNNLWFPYTLFSFGVIIYGIIFLFFKVEQEKFELEYNTGLLNLQMSALKNQFDVFEENRNEMRLLQHDMRHAMETITELFRTGNHDEAELMYLKWQDDLGEATGRLLCSEPYLNAALSIYKRRAESLGVNFIVGSTLPAVMDIDTVKLSIILSNALENAVAAASMVKTDESYVKVKLLRSGA